MWLVARRVAEVYTSLCAGAAAARRRVRSAGALLLDEDAAYRASEQFAEDRQYWNDALAARPEPGSLTLSRRPSAKSGELPARQRRICRAHASKRCEHWLLAAEQASLAS